MSRSCVANASFFLVLIKKVDLFLEQVLTKMRKDLRSAKETVIKVTNKERVNMKLSVACELLWTIKVDDKYDINLTTSWKGENGEKEPSLEKSYGKVQRKTDRVSIPCPGTYSLMLDNSYSWLNTKVVKLSFVTVSHFFFLFESTFTKHIHFAGFCNNDCNIC